MSSNIYTDKEIVEKILQSDKKVLSFLYEHNFDSLRRKILSEGGTNNDAQDIFHDALMVLFVKIRNEDFKLSSSIHTFLQAIARNLWKKFQTTNPESFKRIENESETIPEEYLDEEYILIERRKLYLKYLSELPEDCKRMIQLVIKGVSLKEITRIMAYNSVEFTKTKRYRCKVMLINKISTDPLYNDLKNERFRTTGTIPRW
jgi:RNA polymerase sigma factor (sigma-70 family)